jgi:hypothetical protein
MRHKDYPRQLPPRGNKVNKPLLDESTRLSAGMLRRLHKGRELWAGVEIARNRQEISEILHHRYAIYMRDRGPHYPGLDHDALQLRDDEDKNAILLFTHDESGKVVASMRIRLQSIRDLNHLEQIAFVGASEQGSQAASAAQLARMCSSGSQRASPQLFRMMLYAYFFGISNGVRFAFLSSRINTQVLYENLGYRAMGQGGDGLVPMGIDLLEWQHLVAVASPYLSILSILEAPRSCAVEK